MTRLAKNIIYNILGQGLTFVMLFVAVRYIFKQLGEDALGIIYFANMMNALICGVLEMGISSTTVREVSAHFQTGMSYIRDLSRTFSLFFWGAFIIIGVGIYFLAPMIVRQWIQLKTMDEATAIYILRILGIASITALPKAFYVSLLRGLERMEFNNLIDIGTIGLQQGGTIVILALGGSLLQVVYWIAACYVLAICIYLFAAIQFFTWQAMIPGCSLTVVRKNLGFASKMMFISITGAVLIYTDKVILSKLLPIGIFGYYCFAYNVVSKGSLLTIAISQAAYPAFSSLYQAGDHAGMMVKYRKVQDLVCIGSAPLFAAIPFAALPFFSFVLNEQAAQLLLLPATLLAVGFYLNGILALPYYFALAAGKPEVLVRQRLLDMFITPAATVFLVYHYSLVGAGLSLVLCYSLYFFYSIPRICSLCLKLPAWKWYLHAAKIFLLTGVTFGGAWLILGALPDPRSVAFLTLGYTGALVVFLAGVYFIISPELRQSLLPYLRRDGWAVPKIRESGS